MKKAISVVLCLCLLTICFAGCSNAADNYVPTGDALVYEENYTGETVTHDKEEEKARILEEVSSERKKRRKVVT